MPEINTDFVRKLEEQADDYKELRHALYKRVDLQSKRKILDLGCGTGVITADIASSTDGEVIGVDINSENLQYAQEVAGDVTLINADILDLPFKDNTFDLVVFCVVLTHINQQQKAVNEMARVTQKNGIVLATMEPDYASAFSYPEDKIHSLLLEKLEERGTVVCTGRKLRSLFSKAGLKTEIGMFTDAIDNMNKDSAEQVEEFLRHFWYLEKVLSRIGWEKQQIEDYKQDTIELLETNVFFEFMPAFYAIGRK